MSKDKDGNVRKALQISPIAHEHLMKLAAQFGVTQMELVEAMLKNVDETRLRASLAELASERTRIVEEREKKRSLVERALKDMSVDELAKLLDKHQK